MKAIFEKNNNWGALASLQRNNYVLLVGAAWLVVVLLCYSSSAVANNVPGFISGSTDAKSYIESKGENIINIFSLCGMFACIGGAIYGGIKIGTGDPEKGKGIVISSLVGAAIILGVQSIIGIVLK